MEDGVPFYNQNWSLETLVDVEKFEKRERMGHGGGLLSFICFPSLQFALFFSNFYLFPSPSFTYFSTVHMIRNGFFSVSCPQKLHFFFVFRICPFCVPLGCSTFYGVELSNMCWPSGIKFRFRALMLPPFVLLHFAFK